MMSTRMWICLDYAAILADEFVLTHILFNTRQNSSQSFSFRGHSFHLVSSEMYLIVTIKILKKCNTQRAGSLFSASKSQLSICDVIQFSIRSVYLTNVLYQTKPRIHLDGLGRTCG